MKACVIRTHFISALGFPHRYILQLCNIYYVLLGFDAVDCVQNSLADAADNGNNSHRILKCCY